MPKEIPPEVQFINQKLIDEYGYFEGGDKPLWRIVWSQDQFEYRLGTYAKFDNHGNYIGQSQEEEFQYVPKYRQWINEKWVLERLVPVPLMNNRELVGNVSYEPVFPYQDNRQRYLPPKWEITKLVIESILEEAGKKVGVKYKDPAIEEKDPEVFFQHRLDEIMKLEEQLFGNESNVADSLAYKTGVAVPQNFEKSNKS